MKKIIAFIVSVLVAVCALSGCGNKTPDTNQTLEIYNLHNGYGNEWVEALIDSFKEQQWVKDKYPELIVDFQHNDIYGTAHNYLSMGQAANTVDLMFSAFMRGYAGQPQIADLTDSVYNSTVPGEGDVKVIDKMFPSIANGNKYLEKATGDIKYYTMSYVNGMTGILYNEDKLNALGLNVPLTTDMFVETMDSVKGLSNSAYQHKYSIMASANTAYWYPLYSIWWAQREGITEYENFYEGIANELEGNKDIFKQQGRREALDVMQSIFTDSKQYMNSNAYTATYDEAQTSFLSGDGLFHCNGDYFTSEMALIRERLKNAYGYDFTIKYMKTPVISTIVDRLTSIKTAAANRGISSDAMLRLLIADIDNNITECAYIADGVTQGDYDLLAESRNMVQSGSGLTGLIPDYANGKSVAIDFMRFMATDVAYDDVMEKTQGHMLPFDRDIKTENFEVYQKLTSEQKSKVDIYSNKIIPITIVPTSDSFDLGRAGLTPLNSIEQNGKVSFESIFEIKSAQDIFEGEIRHWNDNRWEQLLGAAGR